MTKLFTTLIAVKATVIAASTAIARGDTLPVALVSALLGIVQLGARPVGQAVPQKVPVVSSSHDPRAHGLCRHRTDDVLARGE
jgi:hypothetical protein